MRAFRDTSRPRRVSRQAATPARSCRGRDAISIRRWPSLDGPGPGRCRRLEARRERPASRRPPGPGSPATTPSSLDRSGAGRGGRGSAHAVRRRARAGARPSGRRLRRSVATGICSSCVRSVWRRSAHGGGLLWGTRSKATRGLGAGRGPATAATRPPWPTARSGPRSPPPRVLRRTCPGARAGSRRAGRSTPRGPLRPARALPAVPAGASRRTGCPARPSTAWPLARRWCLQARWRAMPSSQSRNLPRAGSNRSNCSMASSQTSWLISSATSTIAADEVVDQPEDVADVALVHHVPGGTVAPGHRPDETDFVVHLPVASLGSGVPPPFYCREPAKSFAEVRGITAASARRSQSPLRAAVSRPA